ncbi:ACP S-malonyltransferase [Candidatus Woesearchaeota archaeon]|nr:ACP S-malonyltransferase [Candidatus Woesearchaeota archaeon]
MTFVDHTLAFVFPGQGSQSVGMLTELAEAYPVVESTFSEASRLLGYDLWDTVKNGPETRLNLTAHTQPAMLAAGVAAWRVWCQHTEARPAWLAGHSLGEYTALVCSGFLDFEHAVSLVAERGRLMQEAVEPGQGAMAAILNLEDQVVVEVCQEASTPTETVVAANFNAPGQVVVAGHRDAVARAMELARVRGARRVVLLPVSVPSHSPLMQTAALKLRERLAVTPFQTGYAPVIHNVDVAFHPYPDSIRQALEQQLHSSVRWVEVIRHIQAQGVTRYVECGPGKVLAGLNKRVVPEACTEMLFDPDSLKKALELVNL